MDKILIRKAKPQDAELLSATCRNAYSTNLASYWHEGGLEEYLNTVFSIATLRQELQNAHIRYFIAVVNEQPVGFMKLNLQTALPDAGMRESMQLENIYIMPGHQGKGLGKALLGTAIETAYVYMKKSIWLCVTDTNQSAINFYSKAGFIIYSQTTLNIPYLKDELRGCFNMLYELPPVA